MPKCNRKIQYLGPKTIFLGITCESDWTVCATKCKRIFNVPKYLQDFWFPKDVGFPWYDKDNNSPTYVRLETHFDNQEQRSGKFIMTKSSENNMHNSLLDNSNKRIQKQYWLISAQVKLNSRLYCIVLFCNFKFLMSQMEIQIILRQLIWFRLSIYSLENLKIQKTDFDCNVINTSI